MTHPDYHSNCWLNANSSSPGFLAVNVLYSLFKSHHSPGKNWLSFETAFVSFDSRYCFAGLSTLHFDEDSIMKEPVVDSQLLYLAQYTPTFFRVNSSSYPIWDTLIKHPFADSDPLSSLADLYQLFSYFAALSTNYWVLQSTNLMPTEDQIFG